MNDMLSQLGKCCNGAREHDAVTPNLDLGMEETWEGMGSLWLGTGMQGWVWREKPGDYSGLSKPVMEEKIAVRTDGLTHLKALYQIRKIVQLGVGGQHLKCVTEGRKLKEEAAVQQVPVSIPSSLLTRLPPLAMTTLGPEPEFCARQSLCLLSRSCVHPDR